MGLFKQMKDMKGVVESAPDMIRNAQALGAQAQEMQIAQQAAAQQAMAQQAAATQAPVGTSSTAASFGGVTMEQYATVCKRLNNAGGTPDQAPAHAAALGISAESWAEAETGFTALMTSDPSAGSQFATLYVAAN
jgi:hypothetical protein